MSFLKEVGLLINKIIHCVNIHTIVILIFIYLNNFRYSGKKKYIINEPIPLIVILTLVVLVVRTVITSNTEPSKLFLYILSIVGVMLNIVSLVTILIYLKVQNKAANIDYLTNAYNRRYLDNYINEKIHYCKNNRKFSCILIDLDKFKQTNDMFGHGVGDEILIITVELLKRYLNKKDIVARYGGDEFFVILNISNKIDLENAVNRINKIFEDYNLMVSASHQVHYSIGYDVYEHSMWNDCNSFIRHMDMLMYADKILK